MTLTIAVQIPPMLAQLGIIPGNTLPSRLGLDMEEAASALGVISLLAVTLTVTGLQGGRPAIAILLRRTTRWRAGLGWWFVAAAALPLGTIGFAMALGDTAEMPSATALVAELLSVGIALFCINLWEEAAWAGFLQTRLERDHNLFVAAFLTAVPFSAVHLPLRVITGEATTLGGLTTAFLSLMIFTPIMRVLFGCVLRAHNSVLLVAVMHTAFNRSNNSDGIAADVLTGDARQLAALLATAALTVVLLLCLRRRLSGAERAALDGADTLGSAKAEATAGMRP